MSKSINTVGELKKKLEKFPDDMPIFVITHFTDRLTSSQHNLQKVKEYHPWHGDHKLLGLHIHEFNSEIK